MAFFGERHFGSFCSIFKTEGDSIILAMVFRCCDGWWYLEIALRVCSPRLLTATLPYWLGGNIYPSPAEFRL